MKHTRFDGGGVFLKMAALLGGGVILTFLCGSPGDAFLGLVGVSVALYFLLHASNKAERADRRYERELADDDH